MIYGPVGGYEVGSLRDGLGGGGVCIRGDGGCVSNMCV